VEPFHLSFTPNQGRGCSDFAQSLDKTHSKNEGSPGRLFMKIYRRDDNKLISIHLRAEYCHCEEQRDEAISISREVSANEIASLRSQ
jgi:hypothetical protein